MYVINTLADLKKVLLSSNKRFHLYGAGYQAFNFLSDLASCGIKANISDILVTNIAGNPANIRNIPVVQCDKKTLDKHDYILLTLNDVLKMKVITYLEDCDAILLDPFPAIYYDLYNSIKSFAEHFPKYLTGLNKPISHNPQKTVWTCWWQGVDHAPEIVKACWKSQQKHLPHDIQHVIITKDNYSDYITIPDYVLDKFVDGKNLIAHLADYIRACILYKYGGVWLDSTVLLLDTLPEECWTLPLYTWQFDAAHYFSKTIWCTWFLAARQESILYQFVMEAFLFYFSNYEKVKYYLTIDYFISICTNVVDGILEQFRQIPYNNATAANLGRHLHEPYNEVQFREYCKGSFLQKLSWHLNEEYTENSIFNHIINEDFV